MNKLAGFSTLLLLWVLSGLGAGAIQAEEEDRPPMNMVFVLVDDLRFDGMGFLQQELQTPNIDALASQGVYFKYPVVGSQV